MSVKASPIYEDISRTLTLDAGTAPNTPVCPNHQAPYPHPQQIDGGIDRRTFIKYARLLALPVLPGGATRLLLNTPATVCPVQVESTLNSTDQYPLWDPQWLRINIIGAGGLGARLVRQIQAMRSDPDIYTKIIYDEVRYFAIDTDPRDLDSPGNSPVRSIWLPDESGQGGPSLTAETGKHIARLHSARLSAALNLPHTAVCIIVGGLGRGAGTGITQEVVRRSREAGVFTMVVMTQPLSFENRTALMSLELQTIARSANILLIVPHDESDPGAQLRTVLANAESEIARKVTTFLDNAVGNNCMSFDLNDVEYIFSTPGVSWSGTWRGPVDETPLDPSGVPWIDMLTSDRGLPNCESVRGALILFTTGIEVPLLHNYKKCIRQIKSQLPKDFHIMSGLTYDCRMLGKDMQIDIWLPDYRTL